MRIIKLTTQRGKIVYYNMEKIIYFTAGSSGGTELYVGDTLAYDRLVKETPEEICDKLSRYFGERIS